MQKQYAILQMPTRTDSQTWLRNSIRERGIFLPQGARLSTVTLHKKLRSHSHVAQTRSNGRETRTHLDMTKLTFRPPFRSRATRVSTTGGVAFFLARHKSKRGSFPSSLSSRKELNAETDRRRKNRDHHEFTHIPDLAFYASASRGRSCRCRNCVSRYQRR